MKMVQECAVINQNQSINSMPCMIRKKSSVGKKIAYSILGTPVNIKQDKPGTSEKLAKKIFFSSTHNVR